MNPDPRLGKFPFGILFGTASKKRRKKLAKIARIDGIK
jgi:hypothetical protein